MVFHIYLMVCQCSADCVLKGGLWHETFSSRAGTMDRKKEMQEIFSLGFAAGVISFTGGNGE